MRLNIITFPSSFFTYNKATQTLVAEASEMENRQHQQLYDDSADVGFAVRSSITQKRIIFGMVDVKKDAEGEIISWLYAPTAESIRLVPECLRMKAEIFND